MRLANAVHEAHPWVIARIAPDFELLDVWELPAEGRADEFEALIETVMSLDPTRSESRATRALFALRFRLGALFGWDDGERALPVPGRAETTLSARVPQELRDEMAPPVAVGAASFVPIYRTENEAAAEISNSTVHGVMQLTWVERANGVYVGRMAIYVKSRGRLGALYMAAIAPFRHLIVYPTMMREVGRAWDSKAREAFRDR